MGWGGVLSGEDKLLEPSESTHYTVQTLLEGFSEQAPCWPAKDCITGLPDGPSSHHSSPNLQRPRLTHALRVEMNFEDDKLRF